jgi:hypothetical protein
MITNDNTTIKVINSFTDNYKKLPLDLLMMTSRWQTHDDYRHSMWHKSRWHAQGLASIGPAAPLRCGSVTSVLNSLVG